MKSNEFNVNEAFFGIDPWKMAAGYALNKMRGSNPTGIDPQQEKNFIEIFTQQYNRENKIHPNLNIDDFLDMYFRKNNWDASNLPATYQQSLDNAKQAVTANPSPQTVQQLASVVYNIALMLPSGGGQSRQQQTQQAQQTAPASAPAASSQLDPETIQILGKIRGMKNTPENIIDLTDIISMSLMKLQRISPKSYAKVISRLMSHGGRPSAPAPSPAAPNYSGGQRQAPPPSNVTYNNTSNP
jgi:hypothetical protein